MTSSSDSLWLILLIFSLCLWEESPSMMRIISIYDFFLAY